MERSEFNHEHVDNEVIPEHILKMYRVDGHDEIEYEKYLKSKKLFESETVRSEQNEENQNTVMKIKNEILSHSGKEAAVLIFSALQNNDIEIQRIGASLVEYAPEDQRPSLRELTGKKIAEAIESQDIQIQRIGINMVQFARPEDRQDLRELVLQKITDGLNSDDIEVQRILAKKIDVAPEEAQDMLREKVYEKIIVALNEADIRGQRLAAVMVQYAPFERQVELRGLVKKKFELAKQQRKFSEIVDPYLYTNGDQENESLSTFSRGSFSKTGSETTLLFGKQFRNNIIIRHIEEPNFLAWKKAYESYSDWSGGGFDYVPIEPIYSFTHESHNNRVDVASGVLDINLEEWKAFSGNTFSDDLDEQKNKVAETLTKLGITHGHLTDANFCLRFSRNENGQPDLDRTPKVYLIDFDKAIL